VKIESVKIDRKEFLEKAFSTGIALFGTASLFEILESSDLFAKSGSDRYAMAIDIKKCLAAGDCTKCSTACHSAYNVPLISDKGHEVKWIWKEKYKHAFSSKTDTFANKNLMNKKVPVLCNHCTNAPCVRVCPTKATFKRKDGIVAMDMHRCIGCRYCMAACPYGSRSFNFRDPKKFLSNMVSSYPPRTKGVVEKCNFCAPLLDQGGTPHCVKACDAGALSFGKILDEKSSLHIAVKGRYVIRRKPELSTEPAVYYLV